jgi:hypothetical protein
MPPFLLAAALAASAAAPAPAVAIPPQLALTQEIEARDTELFRLVFETCDPERLRALIAPDLEFYHDKGGVMRSADTFLADYRKTCDSWKAPNAWRSRRALVKASLQVDPVPGYGAIEAGEHLFYERQGNGPEKLVGRATFAQLWVRGTDGSWRLSRVFSYGHRAVEQAGPENQQR